MKFSFLFIGFLMIINPIFAQPQKINYQAVAVGANGKPIKNSTVGLRLSLLDSLPTGSTLYTETQTASTDAAGQFSIYLGGGTATAGTFANLPWANGTDKFLKVEMDAQGGSNYQSMGTTQLVSVPYAMAAGSLREGALLYGNNGQKYQISIDSMGPRWTCFPPATTANAGPDQLNVCASSVTLAGNSPSSGTAAWSIISGTGGNLGTANAPSTTFAGVRGNSYYLRYSITNACGSSADTVAVSLAPATTVANAGPDQLSLAGTTATLAANAPAAGETGAWSILSGSGGSLNNSSNPTATFTKGTDSAYTLVWTITTNSCGINKDTLQLLFSTAFTTPCGQSVVYGGVNYPTIQIGTQCWMSKNLNVGAMVNSANHQTNNTVIEKYCYSDLSSNCTTYGGLYQWAEAVQYANGTTNSTSPSPGLPNLVQGICPVGWHIPRVSEITLLTFNFNGSFNAGGDLKSTSALWNAPNTGATNNSGFSALPGGRVTRTGGGLPSGRGNFGNFWTTGNQSSSGAQFLLLRYDNITAQVNLELKEEGFSVRCLQD
jgi:uncharacterized protein (TIGR02145 family)